MGLFSRKSSSSDNSGSQPATKRPTIQPYPDDYYRRAAERGSFDAPVDTNQDDNRDR